MLEGEVAFVDRLDDLLDIVEDGIRSNLSQMLFSSNSRARRMRESLKTLEQSRMNRVADDELNPAEVQGEQRDVMRDLRLTSEQPFARLGYTSAIARLRRHHAETPFKREPVWGDGLALEHEKWLAGNAGRPIFITNYPANLKPFYMLLSDAALPSKAEQSSHEMMSFPVPTVACFDLLLPGLGEIAGGSLREHRLPELLASVRRHSMKEEEYGWYLDLRRYGSVPHGGWGMGWDRWVSWVSGVSNIKDVVAFPRWLGHCKY